MSLHWLRLPSNSGIDHSGVTADPRDAAVHCSHIKTRMLKAFDMLSPNQLNRPPRRQRSASAAGERCGATPNAFPVPALLRDSDAGRGGARLQHHSAALAANGGGSSCNVTAGSLLAGRARRGRSGGAPRTPLHCIVRCYTSLTYSTSGNAAPSDRRHPVNFVNLATGRARVRSGNCVLRQPKASRAAAMRFSSTRSRCSAARCSSAA